jgi:hypothetical protein
VEIVRASERTAQAAEAALGPDASAQDGCQDGAIQEVAKIRHLRRRRSPKGSQPRLVLTGREDILHANSRSRGLSVARLRRTENAVAPHDDAQGAVPYFSPQESSSRSTTSGVESSTADTASTYVAAEYPSPRDAIVATVDHVPVAQTPVARAPVAHMPVVQTPVVRAPVARAPAVQTPIARAQVAREPVAQAPVVKAPSARVPVVQAPVVQAPVGQAPVVQTPIAQVPVAQTPVAHAMDVPTPIVLPIYQEEMSITTPTQALQDIPLPAAHPVAHVVLLPARADTVVEVNPLQSATPARDVAPDAELRVAVILRQGGMLAATRSHQEETKRLMDEQGRLREEQSRKDASREAMVARMKENQILRDANRQKQIAKMEADRAVVARN